MMKQVQMTKGIRTASEQKENRRKNTVGSNSVTTAAGGTGARTALAASATHVSDASRQSRTGVMSI